MSSRKRSLANKLKAFEIAAINDSWKGSMPTNKHDLIELEYKLAKLQLQLAIGILDSNVRNIRRLHNLETEYIEELAYGGDESPLHIEPPVALAKSKPEPKTKTRPKLRP